LRKPLAPPWPATYHPDMAYERISIDPGRMAGLPCIRDTRVTVSAVLGQLAAGMQERDLPLDQSA